MNHFNVKVGLKTSGPPQTTSEGKYTALHNLLIGDGFHWQDTVEVVLPGKVTPLLSKREDSNITLINELPLETYLECVVGSEMNPAAPIEFLKAHAVISRSWVAGKILDTHKYPESGHIESDSVLVGWDDTESHSGFHVCSDDHCQRYQGLQPISEEARLAIRQTEGMVITSPAGEIVDARFSKCCGGKTELFSTGWQEYSPFGLESFDDPWCDLSDLPESERQLLLASILKDYDLSTEGYGYRWNTTVSKEEIRQRLKQAFNRDVGEIISLEPLKRGPSGRISLIRIRGSEADIELGKELWIRRLLSPSHLYSSAFEIADCGQFLQLSGKGWGHGVGLCQIGAANMAFHGYSFREILSFYYPGTQLSKIN